MTREELNRVLCDALRALNKVERSLGATVRWEDDLRGRLRDAIKATQHGGLLQAGSMGAEVGVVNEVFPPPFGGSGESRSTLPEPKGAV